MPQNVRYAPATRSWIAAGAVRQMMRRCGFAVKPTSQPRASERCSAAKPPIATVGTPPSLYIRPVLPVASQPAADRPVVARGEGGSIRGSRGSSTIPRW